MLEKTRLEMSNEEELLLPLKTILVNLKVIASKVRTNPSFRQKMEKQLSEDCGYNWFGSISNFDEEQLKEQVMKTLAVAVNVAIQKKVDLGCENKVVNPELHQLLDNGKHESLYHHFIPVEDPLEFELIYSPLDLAKYLKKTKTESAPHWLVESIIQHQFDIRWRTHNGDPDDYTFYQFRDNENTTDLLKYIPRQAHVKATLYKECRGESVYHLKRISKQQLCPTVYIRTAGVWKSWRADKDEFNDVEDINIQLSWIKPSIRTFITENADEQSREVEYLKRSLEKHTLYWAVLNDRDFMPGEKLKLKETGRTQVYVGRANYGIQGRWLKDGDNHCEMMKKCLDNVCAMTTYDPLRLEGISLVDARLTLAKVRREETALFVIKTFGDDVEKAKIAVERAEASLHKAIASSREGKASLREAEAPLRAAKTILQKELDQAIVDDSKKNRKTTKSEAEAPLSAAEKSHQKGKRVNSRENIIPYDDDMTWTPKDMGYGMNFS